MSGPAISSTTERLTRFPQKSVNQRTTTALFASSLLIDWLLSIGLESFVEPLDDLSRRKVRRWPIASNSDSRLSIRTADGSKADRAIGTRRQRTPISRDVCQQESECVVDIAER